MATFAAADLLAGPILRRVQPDLVAVWCALRQPAEVTLEVYDGRVIGAPSAAPLEAKPRSAEQLRQQTVRLGERLHIVLALFEPKTIGLAPDRLYSYDLVFKAEGDGPKRLRDLGLLQNGQVAGHPHLALGYAPDALPGFSLPPTALTDLKIVHGSCRNPHTDGRDTMPFIDNLIEGALRQTPGGPFRDATAAARQRPHLLLLTGDQIYADEADPSFLRHLNRVGNELLFGAEKAAELVDVDVQLTPLDQIDEDEEPPAKVARSFPVDELHLPPGRRQRLFVQSAKFSSSSAEGHLLGLNEFASMYLMVWSNVSWPDLTQSLAERWNHVDAYRKKRHEIEDEGDYQLEEELSGDLATRAAYHAGALLVPPALRLIDQYLDPGDHEWFWDDNEPNTSWSDLYEGTAFAGAPGIGGVNKDLDPNDPTIKKLQARLDESKQSRTRDALAGLARELSPSWYAGVKHFGADAPDGKLRSDGVRTRLHRLKSFYDGLPRVRRALANVPVLMTMDDHEITDDWNISKRWVDDVSRSSLGRAVIRNGLVAFALFQAWGNDPRAYAQAGSPQKELLDDARRIFYPNENQTRPTSGPSGDLVRRLESRFQLLPPGLDPMNAPQRMQWHFRFDAPGFEIIGLDSRTQRGFDAADGGGSLLADHGAAALLTDAALEQQIPALPGPTVGAHGISFVIAPAPFLGAVPFEHFGQPVVNLMDEMLEVPDRNELFGWLEADYKPGRLHHDPEPWSYVPRLFEAVLARLSSRKRVVFLSGDVHYSLTTAMSYWRLPARPDATTRFIQLTSSAFKNHQPVMRRMIFHLPILQQLGGQLTNTLERVGWHGTVPGEKSPIEAGTGASFKGRLLEMLNDRPILVPPRIVPAGTVVKRQPEWAWRMELHTDPRQESERGLNPPTTPSLSASDADTRLAAAATRHAWQTMEAPARRFLWDNNLCQITLDLNGQQPVLVHTMYTFDPLDVGGGKLGPHLQHRVPLDLGVDEKPPAVTNA